MSSSQPFPYKDLGARLQKKRESVHESLAEVSGAVEIDIEMLTKIEQGIMLPSEDILLLLISHLNVREDEALRLWEIAGYEKHKSDNQQTTNDDLMTKQVMMVVPFDNRAMYSDSVQITVNKNGVVFNFMQTGGQQPTTVSRIGMSKEHAYTVLDVLKNTLEYSDRPPQMLPEPKTTTDE